MRCFKPCVILSAGMAFDDFAILLFSNLYPLGSQKFDEAFAVSLCEGVFFEDIGKPRLSYYANIVFGLVGSFDVFKADALRVFQNGELYSVIKNRDLRDDVSAVCQLFIARDRCF